MAYFILKPLSNNRYEEKKKAVTQIDSIYDDDDEDGNHCSSLYEVSNTMDITKKTHTENILF